MKFDNVLTYEYEEKCLGDCLIPRLFSRILVFGSSL